MGAHHRARAALTAALAITALCTATAPSVAQTLETDHITADDKAFIAQAAHGGLTEIREARTEANSRNHYVDLYAQRIVKDHLTNYSQLGALAKQYAVDIPGENAVMQQSDSTDTTGTPPPNAPNLHTRMKPMMTDRMYMRQEVRDHQQTIALFQKEAKNGGTAALRTFAAASLPVLQAHLNMAQQFVQSGKIRL